MGSLNSTIVVPMAVPTPTKGAEGGGRNAKARLAPLRHGGDFPTGVQLQRDSGRRDAANAHSHRINA